VFAVSCFCLLLALAGQADNASAHDPAHSADAQLSRAEAAFDRAHDAYESGKMEAGDTALDDMNKALDACLGSLEEAHKSKHYKKAELRVANLQRRMASLLDDIPLPQRGWAEQMSRKLDQTHDKLLEGVMRK
jgi:hypothetical protein